MNTLVSCIEHDYGFGGKQLVRVEDIIADGLTPAEGTPVRTGRMTSDVLKFGPSGSHRVTVWVKGALTITTLYGEVHPRTPTERFIELETRIFNEQLTPVGQLFANTAREVSCVLREFGGRYEHVRVEDATRLTVGEQVFTGLMAPTTINVGPSGSHAVRVWDRRGEVTESRYGLPDQESAQVIVLVPGGARHSLADLLPLSTDVIPQFDVEIASHTAA